MNEITQSSRVTTALRVIERMNEGLTVKDACLEVGMPRSTFYHVISRDTEVISIFQDMVVANQRERLWMALDNQTKMLQKIIGDGLADTTKPKDRLAIFKTLGQISAELSEQLQVVSQDEKGVAVVIPGPQLRKAESRIVNRHNFKIDGFIADDMRMDSQAG